MFGKIFKYFFSRPAPKAVSTTLEGVPPITETQFKDYLKRKTFGNNDISHEDLQAIARVFFNVGFPTANWKLKYAEFSSMYFTLSSVHFHHSQGELTDAILIFTEQMLGTSMKIVVSITELSEVLLPILPADVQNYVAKKA